MIEKFGNYVDMERRIRELMWDAFPQGMTIRVDVRIASGAYEIDWNVESVAHDLIDRLTDKVCSDLTPTDCTAERKAAAAELQRLTNELAVLRMECCE